MPSYPRRSAKISPARRIAFEILKRVTIEEAYASNLLASHLTAKLSNEDRALTHEIVMGVLRYQRLLDHLLTGLLARNLARLDEEVLLALRIGLYQLKYLTRIPAHAIVNESVQLVRMSGKSSAASLVNAVLRKAAQSSNNPSTVVPDNTVAATSLSLSHPDWLLARWADRYGLVSASALAQANNQPAPLSFRLNLLIASRTEILATITRAGLAVLPSMLVKDAYRLTNGNGRTLLELAAQGLIHIQDEASQLVATLVDAQPGLRVLDVCAAPGGKTTALAMHMENRGLIIAGDLHISRVKLIQENAARLGAKIIHSLCFNAAITLPLAALGSFDRVLVDAPCTGTGTLRRNPEIKWRLTPEKINEMANLQLRILDNCAPLVAKGGRLVYSTCSLEEEEDESVIRKFLAMHSEFALYTDLPAALCTTTGLLRTWPQRDDCDGFFAAILVKKS
ncbi:MAG: 16S rRNA (cytosine(967)-C(5))-methyltransferase RsmB [Acidobacteriota bacterium]